MRILTFALATITVVAACGADDDSESSERLAEGQSVSQFLDEFFDETACDGYVPCGDEVEGRFVYQEAKICGAPMDLGDIEAIEESLDELCAPGIGFFLNADVAGEIEVSDGVCTGEVNITANAVIEISQACITDAGGPSIGEACPQLRDELQAELDDIECQVEGSLCTCTASLSELARGNCDDFVLESACLDGDQLRFSNDEPGSEAIWVFTRKGSPEVAMSDEERREVVDLRTLDPVANDEVTTQFASPVGAKRRQQASTETPADYSELTSVVTTELQRLRTRVTR